MISRSSMLLSHFKNNKPRLFGSYCSSYSSSSMKIRSIRLPSSSYSIHTLSPLQELNMIYNDKNGGYNNNNNNNGNNNNNKKTFDSRYMYYGLMGSLGVLASMAHMNKKQKRVQACGIMGMVGDEPVIDYLLAGLNILQNRGYDSAGIATIGEMDEEEGGIESEQPGDNCNPHLSTNHDPSVTIPSKIQAMQDSSSTSTAKLNSTHSQSSLYAYKPKLLVTKRASKGTTSDSLDALKAEGPRIHGNHTCGIAHTRWATHGAKTDINAHPHMDYKQRIALIHNGTIENCFEVRQRLLEKGIPFLSQTDTEVISNLVGLYLDDGKTPEEALKSALSELEGSWGIAMICVDSPQEIYCARNGSPLMIGLGRGRNFVASEHTAFQQYTNEYIALKDGEIAVVTANGVSLDKSRTQKAEKEHIPLSPEPYKHWTIKEIMEQPEAVSRVLAYGSRLSHDYSVKLGGLEKAEDMLLGIRHLIMVGCGTSYHAALYAQRLMQYLNSFETVAVEDAAEVTTDTFPSNASGVLVISQSGETKDVLNALHTAESLSIPRFSLVNAVGSAIARTTGCGVYMYAGREHGVASTKAFLAQVTGLALIAGWFAQKRTQEQTKLLQDSRSGHSRTPTTTMDIVDEQRRKELIEALLRLPLYCGVSLHTRNQCAEIAKKLQHKQHMFVLGKGFAEPIAYEGALKIKEITYLHAEGYSGGALKHGPFALIEEGTPVIMIILDDQHSKTMITNAHEIESRGGQMIYITNNADLLHGLHGDIIQIPSNGCLTALLAAIPMQFIAYEMSVLRGINPDKPKNLAKAVTVD